MTQERIRELTKTMLRKKLYVVLSKGGVAPEKIADHLPRHLEYMNDCAGRQRASGARDRRSRSFRRARAAQLRAAGMDGDGGLARHQGAFFRPVARAGLSFASGPYKR